MILRQGLFGPHFTDRLALMLQALENASLKHVEQEKTQTAIKHGAKDVTPAYLVERPVEPGISTMTTVRLKMERNVFHSALNSKPKTDNQLQTILLSHLWHKSLNKWFMLSCKKKKNEIKRS